MLKIASVSVYENSAFTVWQQYYLGRFTFLTLLVNRVVSLFVVYTVSLFVFDMCIQFKLAANVTQTSNSNMTFNTLI